MKTNTVDMTQGNIYKHIVKFAIPIIISGILQTLYNAADMAVVGQFAENGEKSLAAVGSTGSAISLFINLFVGLSSAANVLVARKFGSGNKSGVSKAVHTAVMVAIVIGVCLSVAGFFLARPLLLWMGSPEDVIDKSTLYMRVYFMGIPAMILYNFGSAILRAVGDAKRPTYYLMGAGIINVLLNLLFVIVFKMDVAGVAVATMIAQAIAAIFVFRSLIKTDDCYKLSWRKLRATATELREMVVMGIPAGIQGCAFSLSNLIIQSSVNDCGSIVMAGNAAAASIDGMVYVTVNAFFHAAITFMGQNYGAHNFKRLKKGYWVTVGVALAFGSVVSAFTCFFASGLLKFYTDSPGAIEAGLVRIKYICSFYMLCGIIEVGAGALRGIGVATRSMIICILGACGFRLLMVEIGAPYRTVNDLILLYISYPISWVITGGTLAIFFFSIVKSREKKWQEYLAGKQNSLQTEL